MSDKITLYCGKLLTDMTKEELIEAVIVLGNQNASILKNSMKEREFWSQVLKGKR